MDSGLSAPQTRGDVIEAIARRASDRLGALPEAQVQDLLEDALYAERKRLERQPDDGSYDAILAEVARSVVRGGHGDRIAAARGLVTAWAHEIHGRFSPRAYRVATRMVPPAVTALLSRRPRRLRQWDLSLDRRVRVSGDIGLVKDLCREATVILAPTHVSNLDSPLIGLALHMAGLPPFVYGAGLNLFSNPMLGWWLRRLGAYTVDRTKRARLYKDTLKDYSTWCLTTRHHSLFFPGGTRARSGAVETRLKKGLLGTGIVAWQEMLAAGRTDPEVYVVPLTLSFQLVLEASTLIDDHLEEAGRQRYIIVDDESARPAHVASFTRRVLDLDASVVVHFGAPLDCIGQPVPVGHAERAEAAIARRAYVCDRRGQVQADPQRDRVYTERLSSALVEAYPRGADIMSTHLCAAVAWRALADKLGTSDPFRLVRAPAGQRRIPRGELVSRIAQVQDRVREQAARGRWMCSIDTAAEATLDTAVDRFGRFHKTRALTYEGQEVVLADSRLCLYYANRFAFARETLYTPASNEAGH